MSDILRKINELVTVQNATNTLVNREYYNYQAPYVMHMIWMLTKAMIRRHCRILEMVISEIAVTIKVFVGDLE